MQSFNICNPNQKFIPIWKLSTNIIKLFGITTFLITEFATVNQKYIFFRSGKRITITKFSFFADNPFKNKHALFGWWNQKWRETKINGSNSRENKVLSLAMDIKLEEPVQTEILWEDGRLRSLKIFTEVFVRFAKELY